MMSNDCEATYSGNTHSKKSAGRPPRRRPKVLWDSSPRAPLLWLLCCGGPLWWRMVRPSAHPVLVPHMAVAVFEHMETDLRSRLDIAPADSEWREDQLPREWVPEKRPSMVKHMARVRERLKR